MVDQVIKMMENYTADLERIVGERTAALEDAQKRADNLLAQMLPPSVAKMLKAGQPVHPKMYNSATVLFADLVGFTALSAQSTPLQVISLLNGLFAQFDAIVNSHDAYKVCSTAPGR